MKQKFDIEGMMCSACAQSVEKAVKSLDGCKTAEVNLLNNLLTIVYDENVLNEKKIIEAVENAGFLAALKEETQLPLNEALDKSLERRTEEENEILRQIRLSLIFLVPLLYISLFHALGAPLPKMLDERTNPIGYIGLQVVLCLPILLINRKFYINGIKSLIKLHPNMDTLIAIGSATAFIYSIISAIHPLKMFLEGFYLDAAIDCSSIYFDSAGMIVTMISIGKYLEAKAKGRTTTAVESLVRLAPDKSRVLRNGKETVISSKDIEVGDTVIIKAGDRIPVDGVLLEGWGCLDESAITGESIPVDKKPGDLIISATVNTDGYFSFKASKVGEDTTLAKIIALVEEASGSKAPISRLADKVSGVFVPTVIGLAVAVCISWIISGNPVSLGISYGICVLVISCPCALGLATPTAIMVSTGVAAKNHILFKSAEIIERLSYINCAVFDKTGTVTTGEPNVSKLIIYTSNGAIDFDSDSYFDADLCRSAVSIAASIESKSSHPFAKAIARYSDKNRVMAAKSDSFNTFEGLGISAKVDGITYYCGNRMLAEKILKDRFRDEDKYSEESRSCIYLFNEMLLIAKFILKDTIKPEAPKAIKRMKELGIQTSMFTGDKESTANEVASICAIDNVYAEMLPAGKEKLLRSLKKSEGKKENVIAMIGDGINDSPALTAADIGIAIGTGTDIAIEAADVVLMRSNLLDAVNAIRLSKCTIGKIRGGLFWALFYNCICIPLAAGAFYPMFGIKLNPMIGAACMSLSSICVVLNALSIKRFKSE